MKFLHAADLHVDSPLVGLSCYEGAPAQRLRDATRRALENLVTLAISETVDLVVIAGDLFDGQWRDMQTGLFAARQFRRLRDEHIPVYLVRGNHDAESQVRQTITWPDNVHEFSVRKVETVRLEKLGVALHGRGYAHRQVTDDPVVEFPEPLRDLFNVGVLHTNVDGRADHDPYAPTSQRELVNKGYQYWALGHIHKRTELSHDPYVGYCGNSQGRHVRETDAKGCLLVTVDNAEMSSVEFRPTDVLRWHWIEVELGETEGLPELYSAVARRLDECRRSSDGRFSAVRVTVRGRTPAHHVLVRRAQREEAVAEIRNQANEMEEDVWIEEIRWETSPPVDIEQLRGGADLLGDLLRHIDRLAGSREELAGLAERLAVLEKHRAGCLEQAGIRVDDPERVRHWLRQAEGLLVTHLLDGGDA